MAQTDEDVRRRRICTGAGMGGTQESARMRGRFFEVHLADFASTQLKRFAALLDCEDADLFDWVIAGSAAPEE